MSLRPRRVARVEVERIDWRTKVRRWVCDACGAARFLPLGSYLCRCRKPPTVLREGILPAAAAAEVERLGRALRD